MKNLIISVKDVLAKAKFSNENNRLYMKIARRISISSWYRLQRLILVDSQFRLSLLSGLKLSICVLFSNNLNLPVSSRGFYLLPHARSLRIEENSCKTVVVNSRKLSFDSRSLTNSQTFYVARQPSLSYLYL